MSAGLKLTSERYNSKELKIFRESWLNSRGKVLRLLEIQLSVGVVWAKYALWVTERLSDEDNLKRGQWMVFGTWPKNLKCIGVPVLFQCLW